MTSDLLELCSPEAPPLLAATAHPARPRLPMPARPTVTAAEAAETRARARDVLAAAQARVARHGWRYVAPVGLGATREDVAALLLVVGAGPDALWMVTGVAGAPEAALYWRPARTLDLDALRAAPVECADGADDLAGQDAAVTWGAC